MTDRNRAEVGRNAFHVFGEKTDEEWLELLERSVTEEIIDGIRFPRFPALELQSQFVGSANSSALREAYYFYSTLKQRADVAGSPICAKSRALDFGCGWGRYLRFLWKDVKEEGIFGVDIDPDILDVCRNTGVPGTLTSIQVMGDLSRIGKFTHILAYSVFTHLPEKVHLHWISEIAKAMYTGGIFGLTLEPRRFLDFVSQQDKYAATSAWHRALANYAKSVPAMKEQFDAGQLVYLPTGGGDHRSSETYGEAVVPLSYIEKQWSRYFEIIDYIDDPARFWQAVLIVKRR